MARVLDVSVHLRSRRSIEVSSIKLVAILLIAAGVFALAYGGFTYTNTTHDTSVGQLEVSVRDIRTIVVPVWAGVGAILLGGYLLIARKGSLTGK